MTKKESIRDEAARRGVSHGKVFSEQKAQHLIHRISKVIPNLPDELRGKDFPVVYARKKITMNRKQVVTTLCLGLIGMILLMFAGCDRYDRIITEALVYEDSVKVYATSERPAYVLVKYTIPLGGCRNYHDTELLWEGGNTYYLTVQASEPHPDSPGDCPTLVWDETVYFGLGSFDSGHYSVHVNGIVKHFEITTEQECLTIE